jgi:hypothetical protein
VLKSRINLQSDDLWGFDTRGSLIREIRSLHIPRASAETFGERRALADPFPFSGGGET